MGFHLARHLGRETKREATAFLQLLANHTREVTCAEGRQVLLEEVKL